MIAPPIILYFLIYINSTKIIGFFNYFTLISIYYSTVGYFLLKYWNKPFVLEIYIRVTKKNCIYTIKIGYGLTLIQKSYVKSPLGFLSFQTSANDTDDGNAGVSIPFGVFTLPNHTVDRNTGNCNVSIPFGVFTLPNICGMMTK